MSVTFKPASRIGNDPVSTGLITRIAAEHQHDIEITARGNIVLRNRQRPFASRLPIASTVPAPINPIVNSPWGSFWSWSATLDVRAWTCWLPRSASARGS